jgi:hypothetical protein
LLLEEVRCANKLLSQKRKPLPCLHKVVSHFCEDYKLIQLIKEVEAHNQESDIVTKLKCAHPH